jgi:hypothetical protein
MTRADHFRMKAMIENRLAKTTADPQQASVHALRQQGMEHLAAYEEWLSGGPKPGGVEAIARAS